ncbi:MAG: choice-of-anchor J domain-containing protein [Candidatus Amulumruptor caecigallinarius]|nr:choice-of-anchor J domain-containing protein [Candidatus Amulumruptor caecigallinarius]
MKKITERIPVSLLGVALLTFTLSAAPPTRVKRDAENAYKTSLRTEKGIRNVGKHKRANSNRGAIKSTPDKIIVNTPKQSVTQRSNSEIPAIYGSVFYSDSRAGIDNTLCRIATSDSEKFEVIVEGVNALDGGAYIDGIYYAANHTEYYGEYQLYIDSFDVASGTKKGTLYGDPKAEAVDVAYNPADGKVYGCFADPESPDFTGYYFGTIDYKTGQTTEISKLPREMAAIAIDTAGKIYVIDKQQEKNGYFLETVGADLYEISAQTGEMTLIGKTGQLPEYRSSACIDPATGRMFWVVNPSDECGYLYEVDKTSGATTLIYQFPDNEEIVGMYIPDTRVNGGVPSAASELIAEFPDGNMQGTISFTMPTLDNEGNELSGNLGYKVTSGADTMASGEAIPGARVNASVTVGDEGLYKFTVVISNSAGNSPESSISTFIGRDTPLAPGSPMATINGANVVITWNPVIATVNGGTIAGENVSYIVKRYPGGEILTTVNGETFANDPIENPQELSWRYYTIEAKHMDIMSAPARTPKVVTGHIMPPYTDDYNDINTFDYYTTIDANGDNVTWGPYIGNLRIAYSDDKTLAMDDWLISPPVMLESGKSYQFSIDIVTGNSREKEDFEVMWGTGNTIADMTNTLIERKSVAHTEVVTYSGFISPKIGGLHYIGIHGCSAPDKYTITIDNFAINSGIDASLPDVCNELVIKSRTTGEMKADISLKAPSCALDGTKLQTLKSITVLRNGDVVKTFENPEPGSSLSCVDEVSDCGTYGYTAFATNDSGNGPGVQVETFVGVKAPANPENVNMVETSNLGEVTVSWDAVTCDIEGNTLNPQYVKYGIYIYKDGELEELFGNLSETSHTFRASNDTENQKFVQYFVAASTKGGYSEGISTPSVPVGKAYKTPYTESFSMGTLSYILASSSLGGASWGLYDNSIGIAAADADNGFIGSKANALSQYSTLYTGNIDLSPLQKPMLSFYVYNIEDEETLNEDELDVEIVCNGVATVERNVKIGQLQDDEGWCRVIVPLTKYQGNKIQLRLTSRHNTWGNIFVDRINIVNDCKNNLTARGLTAPATVKAGSEFSVSAKISNNGSNSATDYSLELLCDGEVIDAKAGPQINSDSDKNVEFNTSLSAIDEDEHAYSFRIVFSNDEDTSDNISEQVTVTPVMPTLPYIKDLSAVESDNGVLLTWSEPDMNDYIPDMITDDFESYESWANKGVGDWVLIDRDGAGIGGFNDGTVFPGIATNSTQSFWVFDSNGEGFKGDIYFMSNSGNKHLAQMFSYTPQGEATCDDWAISPELCGAEQTISFYARCYYGEYPESFEVLYSEGSVNPDDFVRIDSKTVNHDSWIRYDFKLPEGAKRAAIRCVSHGGFMLFIDDFTYTPVGDSSELELIGFNIYRDGKLIKTVDTLDREFNDNDGNISTDPTYQMTALFLNGESRPSDKVKVNPSGISSDMSEKISVRGRAGYIEITEAAGQRVSVYNVDGTVTATSDSHTNLLRITANQGVYLVKVGSHTTKVIVK